MIHKIDTPTRLFDLIDLPQHGRKAAAAFHVWRDGGWHTCMREEYKEKSTLVSQAMLAHGVRRGEAVALVASSRPEWNMIDMGVMQIGATLLPLSPHLEAERYLELFEQAKVRVLILENSDLLDRFKVLLPQMETLRHIFTIDLANIGEAFEALLDEGSRHHDPELLANRRDHVTADDRCTLTLGDDGTLSSLTHKEMIARVLEEADRLAGSKEPAVSNLPLHHLDERVRNYAYQLLGREIHCLPYGKRLGECGETKADGKGRGKKRFGLKLF